MNDAPTVPTRLVLASIAGLWLFYYLLITLRSLIMDDIFALEMSWRRALVTLAGMAVTLLAWGIIRQFDRKKLGWRVAVALAVMLPASISLAMINQRVFAPVEQKLAETFANPKQVGIRHDTSGNVLIDIPDPPSIPRAQIEEIQKKLNEQGLLKQLSDVAIGRYFLLIAWAALYFALVNAEQARTAERREGEYRRAAKAAELRSLRYQVNPHFLFNTLNSLSALVLTGKAQAAERMIQTLSTFYRRSLAEDPTGTVSLEAEVALQRAYLEIEAVRFPERLVAKIDVPGELLAAEVPGMILQPLVENSVKYGVAPISRAVTVRIAASEEQGVLVLEVSDNGTGVASKPGRHSGLGIGLTNVRDRLEARYGEAASLESGPAEGGGWRTVIRLPLEPHD
jgi:two-component system, LytTR family, sensor kinase